MHFWLDCMVIASYFATILILVTVFIFHSERILKQLEEEQQSRKSAEEKLKELEGQYDWLFRSHSVLKYRADQKWHLAISACGKGILSYPNTGATGASKRILGHAPGTFWNPRPKKSHILQHFWRSIPPSRKTLFCEAAVVTRVGLLVVHDFDFHEKKSALWARDPVSCLPTKSLKE